MPRKGMPSLPIGRLAACQCFVICLMVSALHNASAWIPSSVPKGRILGWNAKSTTGSRKATSLGATGDGVLGFVKGLDSALGNPTAYSAAQKAAQEPVVSSSVTSFSNSAGAANMAFQSSGGAANMDIPTSAVLAGGGLAFVAFLGIAFYFVSLSAESEEESSGGFGASFGMGGDNSIDSSFGMNDVTPLPKRTPDENALSQQLEAAEAKFQEQKQPEPEPVAVNVAVAEEKVSEPAVVAEKKVVVSKPSKSDTDVDDDSWGSDGNLLSKLKAKLRGTEAELADANTENEGLKDQLDTQEQTLLETTEKWNYTKAKLQEEMKRKEILETELKKAADANRALEDKYELEQNALKKTKDNLDASNKSLQATEARLARTQGELTRIYGELETTNKILSETAGDLEQLEEEQRSLRKLGRKMWRLSKSRVSNRIQSVGDKLRGRGRKKKNKGN